MSAKRYLIVNADDLGHSSAVNRGVMRAHDHGIVTSASLMVRWPAAVEAAEYARNRPGLSLGLRTLTSENGSIRTSTGHLSTMWCHWMKRRRYVMRYFASLPFSEL